MLTPLVLAATALLGVAPASAATFTVTKTTDSADGACNADCSLREAVLAANAAAGADVINLPPGRYVLSITGADEDASANGDLDINGDLSLIGAGAPSTIIDANGTTTGQRAIQVVGGTVSITGVTITGGNELGAFYPNSGGGIFIDPGATAFTLTNSAVVGNKTDYWSGGLDIEAPSTIENVTVANNVAGEAAGGAEVETTGVTFTNVTFSGNTANEHGGAVALHDPGTIFNNVTMIGNRADADGTGTGDTGGGLYADDSATIRNSIIAGNTVGGAGTDPDCTDNGPITSQGYNLVQVPGTCTFTAVGDLTGVAPNVAPLADNGGPVPTHALLPGSPAINAGNPAAPGSAGTACAAVDARGLPRSDCDIGAYELVFCKGAIVNRIGTEGNDTLLGTSGPDGFLAFGGNDTVRGLGGKDTACLGPGNDIGAGGAGKDRLFGEQGKDRLKGQGGNDRLVGGPGKDTCIGGPGKKDRAPCEVKKSVP